MSLPTSIDPTLPGDSDVAALGPAQLRGIKQYLVDVFGVQAKPGVQTVGAFSINTTGQVQLTADPTVPLGAATKQYVDNAYVKLFRHANQLLSAGTFNDDTFTFTTGPTDCWNIRFMLYFLGGGHGGGITFTPIIPAGAGYRIGIPATNAQASSVISNAGVFLLGNNPYWTVDVTIQAQGTGGTISFQYISDGASFTSIGSLSSMIAIKVN